MCHEGDQSIMDIAIKSGYTKHQLQQINLVHLFLQAETIADMTSACGKYLWPCHTSSSNTDGSRHHVPNQQSWKQWDKLLQSNCNGNKLWNPLGIWIKCQMRKWHFSSDNSYVYDSKNHTRATILSHERLYNTIGDWMEWHEFPGTPLDQLNTSTFTKPMSAMETIIFLYPHLHPTTSSTALVWWFEVKKIFILWNPDQPIIHVINNYMTEQ